MNSLPERFEQQALRRGEHLAVDAGSPPLTYSELSLQSDRCAAALGRWSGGRAALLLSHDSPLLVAALGVVKAGMATVTLNPSDPPARLEQIRRAVEPELVVTDAQHREPAEAAGFHTTTLDELLAEARPKRDLVPPAAEDLAFLICTSGSTGQPKVVMQTHATIAANADRYRHGLGIGADDRIAWLAPLSGGQGLATAWTALLTGATLCPFPIGERGVAGLADWLAENRITVFDTIPSVLRSFARTLGERQVAGVRLVRLASEPGLRADFHLFRRHFPSQCVLASVLACSEAGIIAQQLLHGDDPLADGRLPVGRPAEGVELHLLDGAGIEVPDGQPGEIVVSSRHMSPGYWGDAVLTAERFESAGGRRRFRTGDLGRRGESGQLTVIGRADGQVKIRGHRLQLEEVEAALAAHPEVDSACAVVTHTARGDARLAAFLIPAPGQAPVSSELRRWLRALLPAHAVPAAFATVEAFPLGPHGKVDRAALAASIPTPAAPAAAPEQSPAQRRMMALWADALGLEAVAADARFLDLGGDSLSAAVIAAGVQAEFGLELELAAFAADPTPAALAERVLEASPSPRDEAEPRLVPVGRMGLLSSSQLRIWRLSQVPGTRTQHVVVPFEIRGPLDTEALRRSLEGIIARHEILRSIYVDHDGRPMAHVEPPTELDLPVVDLRRHVDPEAQALEIVRQEAMAPCELARGPLLRLRLLRLDERRHQLIRVSHHIIHDAQTWPIFFDELVIAYEAIVDGRPVPLPARAPLQYIDYALWEHTRLRESPGRVRAAVDWWQQTFDPRPPVLRLPANRGGAPEESWREEAPRLAEVIHWGLPGELAGALDELGRQAGATFYMTRLAALAAVLSLESGLEDIALGTAATNRRRTELLRMLGPFHNRTAVRLRVPAGSSFRELLAEARRAVVQMSAHAIVPYERVWAELARAGLRRPALPVKFDALYQLPPLRFGGLEMRTLNREWSGAGRSLTIGVDRFYEAERCRAIYDPEMYDGADVRRLLDHLTSTVAAACAHPDRPLRRLL